MYIYSVEKKNTIRLRLGLSHLNELKFEHSFQDCINPLGTCSLEIESVSHFFLHYCHYFTNIHPTLLSELQSVDANIAKFSDNEIVDLATSLWQS